MQLPITAPTTLADDASPSQSVYEDACRVFRLIEDERHLSAHSLYESVWERINGGNDDSSQKAKIGFGKRLRKKEPNDVVETKKTKLLLHEKTDKIKKLEVGICQIFFLAY
jgi:hypothetical protein